MHVFVIQPDWQRQHLQDSVSTCGQGWKEHISLKANLQSVCVLCVSIWGCVVDGDHAVVAGGAELIYVIALDAAELHPGLWGWGGVDYATWHGAERVQRQAALTCGLGLFGSRFGTPS